MVFSWPTLHISGLFVAEVMHEKCQNGCIFPGNGGSHTQLATWAIVLSTRNESELACLEACLFIELDQLILEA